MHDTSCLPVTAKSKSPTWHPILCLHINVCPFWNTILALHLYLCTSSFSPLMPSLPCFWLCDHFYQHADLCFTTQVKIPCPPLLFFLVCKKQAAGSLLRSWACSEAHSKRWSGSVYKSWESTTHVFSPGMVLQAWSAFPSPTYGMSRCVLLPQSSSSKAHKSWKDKIQSSFCHFF